MTHNVFEHYVLDIPKNKCQGLLVISYFLVITENSSCWDY